MIQYFIIEDGSIDGVQKVVGKDEQDGCDKGREGRWTRWGLTETMFQLEDEVEEDMVQIE